MMKKSVAIFAAVAIMLSMAACSAQATEQASAQPESQTEVQKVESDIGVFLYRGI